MKDTEVKSFAAGIGRLQSDSALYEGQFIDGKPSGYGRLIFDGKVYDGYFTLAEPKPCAEGTAGDQCRTDRAAAKGVVTYQVESAKEEDLCFNHLRPCLKKKTLTASKKPKDS